jgi:DNA-binding NarL/FixJ family response regulator
MLRVLIADDHPVVRRGLKEILHEAFEAALVVGEASTGPEVLQAARADVWDVVVLDITMPGPSGLDILKALKLSRPNVRVLMLSMHSDSHYVLGSLRAGASGYLNKETASDELVQAVEAVLEGKYYVSRDLAEKLKLSL